MSFSLIPPEINSAMVYTGPGSSPLIAAATAWDGLAAELTATVNSLSHTTSGLTGTWQGPSSAAFTGAMSPYITWMSSTAAQAAQIGTQAKAAAALFDTVHSAVVPPPVIAANRALLLALISTNFFGQNTPAIMATEAHYEQMWAQDGAAMDSYSAASQTNNASLQQPTQPPQVGTGQTPHAAQAVDPSQVANSTAGTGDATTTATNPLTSLMNMFSGASTTAGDTGAGVGATNPAALQSLSYLNYALMPIRYLTMLTQFARMGATGSSLAGQSAGNSGTGTLMTQIGDFVNEKLQGAVGTLVGHFSSATNAISAKLGQAASMGALKVPQAWSMAADGMVRAAPVLPATTVSAPIQTMSATSGMPGGPFGNAMLGAMAGRGMGAVAAKAPKVIPRSPSGG